MLAIARLFWLSCLSLILTSMGLAGCSNRHEPKGAISNTESTEAATEGKPMGIITKMKALDLAQQKFQKTGENREDYQVVVEDDPPGERWVVSFKRKYSPSTPRPVGGGYWATVEKKSGKVFFRAED